MKLIGLIILGCIIAYILIFLDTMGLILGLGILIGLLLNLCVDINEIKRILTTKNNNRQ